MKVFHFGPPRNPLLGTLHSPSRLRPSPVAVLLCNPFGEEAARGHRIYRVLATQLERRGYPALRFDYHATGDSMGESGEASLAGWLDDVVLAAGHLTTATGARRLVAVGLRAGGTLAALATSRRALRLAHLIMWDPVVHGAAYLDELGAMHRSHMLHEMGAKVHPEAHAGREHHGEIETLGTPISAALAAELRGVDLTAEVPQAGHITVICSRETPALGGLRARMTTSPPGSWIDLPASVAWNSDEALNAAIVPMDAVQAIVARIEETSR